MIQRFFGPLFVIAVLIAVACVDMSAPKGAASISVLMLPSPSVIVGDSMRDSMGTVAPLKVIAYDAAGVPIADATTEFFVTDTLSGAHIAPQNVLVGDRVGIVRVVGQIGNLSTPVANVPVAYLPAKIVAGTKPDTLRLLVGTDSATSLGSSALGVTVKSAKDSGSAGMIVRFTILKAPAAKPDVSSPAVFFASGSGVAATADTTDGNGTTSHIRLFVNSRGLADRDLVVGSKIDSAVVEARASYKGVLLPGSPVRVVVPIKSTLFRQ